MPFPRPNLIVVIDGLLPEQLTDLGHHIKKLPVPPIVTLVKTVPILGNESLEEERLKAKYNLVTAQEALHFPAAIEIVSGSNPRNAETFFREGAFDAMIRGSNGQPVIIVKNSEALGIQALANAMSAIIDVSAHKAFQHSYKGVFAKPRQANVIEERQPVMSQEHGILKPKA